mmetsp:Transcript_1835/g.4516  ORF Transcript_1835/g.4516 Transcript_1835/m.4516 type:complete len:107 (+) Transcript_1835:938-1258(+)
MGPSRVPTPLVAFLLAMCHPQQRRLRRTAAVMGRQYPKKMHAAMPPTAQLLGVGIWGLEAVLFIVALFAACRLACQHGEQRRRKGDVGPSGCEAQGFLIIARSQGK